MPNATGHRYKVKVLRSFMRQVFCTESGRFMECTVGRSHGSRYNINVGRHMKRQIMGDVDHVQVDVPFKFASLLV